MGSMKKPVSRSFSDLAGAGSTVTGRILNYGDVIGGTAGTAGNEMMVEGVHNPVRFKDMIAKQKSLLTK